MLFAPPFFEQLDQQGQGAAWPGGELHQPLWLREQAYILAASAAASWVPSIAAPGPFSLPQALVPKLYRV